MNGKGADPDSAEILGLLAETPETPRDIAASLREFSRSAQFLSDQRQRLIEAYPDKYVAVARGRVVADADTLDAVLEKVDGTGIARNEVIVRLIERAPRTLIL